MRILWTKDTKKINFHSQIPKHKSINQKSYHNCKISIHKAMQREHQMSLDAGTYTFLNDFFITKIKNYKRKNSMVKKIALISKN